MEAATVTAPAQLESFNPATGESIGAVQTTAPEDVQAVVDAVAAVQPAWGRLSLEERGRYLARASQVLLDEDDEIRDLLAREQGKPRTEAFSMEVLPTIDALQWIARAGAEILSEEKIPMSQWFLKTKRSAFVYEPLGVIGVISPWNYPWSIPMGEVALALMAGNGVVLKPASLTPLIGERIVQVFERAGVPSGLVRVVHGPGTGAALAESTVGKVFFTGSVETGRSVAEACARRLKGCVLELGGKDPMIVLDDVRMEHAVVGGDLGRLRQRRPDLLGHRARVRAALGGGPLHRRGGRRGRAVAGRRPDELGHRDRPDGVVRADGDRPLAGRRRGRGRRHAALRRAGRSAGGAGRRVLRARPSSPASPTTCGSCARRSSGRCSRSSSSTPRPRRSALANDSEFGLGASVWTADRARGERIAGELESGMVWINDHMFSHGACQCAWGGVKDSGLGRTHSKFGLYECVNVKLRVWEGSTMRDPWWHPYDETLGKAFRQSAKLLYGRSSERATALRDGAVPLMKVGARMARDVVKR